MGCLVKPIRYSSHAEKNLEERSILRADVESAIRDSDFIQPGSPPRYVACWRYFDNLLQQDMLLRVVFEEDEKEISVITLYKTSKLRKYLIRKNP